MTAVDPGYAGKAAQIVAARTAAEAARRVRRRIQWGSGHSIDELLALPVEKFRLSDAEKHYAEIWALLASVNAMPIRNQRLIFPSGSPLNDAFVRHAASVDPNLLAALRAAEGQ